MSIPFEWRIRDIEQAANEAKRRLHELDTLRSDVDRMEHTLRETRTETAGLRDELQTCQDKLTQLETRLFEIANK